jgi:DNA ligase-1
MAYLAQLAQVSDAVAGESGRLAKIGRLAAYLRELGSESAGLAACLLAGELPRGRIGVGPAQVAAALGSPPADGATLTLAGLDQGLAEIAAIAGSGAQVRRQARLAALFGQATDGEQALLRGLLTGALRQGATAGLVQEAVARAAGVPPGQVRRAVMLCGDLRRVTAIALAEGTPGLASIGLNLFRPVQPMLAEPAEGLGDALDRLDRPFLEYKLDGARIQVHKSGEEVRVYSRQGNEVTAALPEIRELVAPLPERDLVLDGEVLALGLEGRPQPFQVTMRRFGRRLETDRLRQEIPLTPYFFDCLQRSGSLLIDAPARERFRALGEALPPRFLIPRLVPRDRDEASAFLARALAEGHEGLMAKDPASLYQSGGRGANWLKIKQAQTLDLVVLAAEWGSGRRSAWLSNLHLGARDGFGGFVMLGKTFKGLTDALLAWQTQRLLALAIEPGDTRGDPVVRVRPELVVETAFNELQESPRYPGGLALRFARVKRYRPDKGPGEADDMATVRALFARQVAYAGRTTATP